MDPQASRTVDLTKDQIWSLIAPLKKAAWYNRTRSQQIKTNSDWGDLWKALCYTGMILDKRFTRRTRLSSLILEKDFKDGPQYTLTRGQQQSSSYRYNRVEENAHRFCNHMIYDKYPFKLDFVFSVNKIRRYEATKVGYVIAANPMEAQCIADLLYAPFFTHDPDWSISTSTDYCTPIIDNNTDVFFELMSECLKETLTTKKRLFEQIEAIKKRIEKSDLIEDCINLNLCAYESNNG